MASCSFICTDLLLILRYQPDIHNNIIYLMNIECCYFPLRDEGVHWAVQNGLHLSRSTVVYFKHNDMASLESTLEKVTKGNKRAEKIRRYIVIEAVYQVSFTNYYYISQPAPCALHKIFTLLIDRVQFCLNFFYLI